MFFNWKQGPKIRSSFWLKPLENISHSTLLKHPSHTVDVPNSNMSQGYGVMTLMVMNDVDTPSHRTNSPRDCTNIPTNIHKV